MRSELEHSTITQGLKQMVIAWIGDGEKLVDEPVTGAPMSVMEIGWGESSASNPACDIRMEDEDDDFEDEDDDEDEDDLDEELDDEDFDDEDFDDLDDEEFDDEEEEEFEDDDEDEDEDDDYDEEDDDEDF